MQSFVCVKPKEKRSNKRAAQHSQYDIETCILEFDKWKKPVKNDTVRQISSQKQQKIGSDVTSVLDVEKEGDCVSIK